MASFARALQGIVVLGYPFWVFAGLRVLEARHVALLLAALLLARAVRRRGLGRAAGLSQLLVPALLVGAVLVGSALSNDERLLKLTPVAVNAALLVGFGRTLVHGPPLVETLARLQVADLPEDEVRYCRSVTILWCAFFVANGAVSAWLAIAGSSWAWTLYSGFVAYLLMGGLFAAEFVVRAIRFGRYRGTVVEPLFRRLLGAAKEEEA